MQPSLPKTDAQSRSILGAECDVFCITGYAGWECLAAGAAGSMKPPGTRNAAFVCCPRCGGASLMGVPQEAVEEPPEGQESFLPHQAALVTPPRGR